MIRATATVAASLLTVAAVSAGIVALSGLEAETRGFLRFDFRGPAQPSLEIAAQNARLAAAALVGAAVLPRFRKARQMFDALAVAILSGNAALIGVAVAAYGVRTVRALALHGPLELVALSLAGGAYLGARDDVLPTVVLCRVAATCAALLLIAGVIETSVQIGGLR